MWCWCESSRAAVAAVLLVDGDLVGVCFRFGDVGTGSLSPLSEILMRFGIRISSVRAYGEEDSGKVRAV